MTLQEYIDFIDLLAVAALYTFGMLLILSLFITVLIFISFGLHQMYLDLFTKKGESK